jgi:polysaccharide chain length determinant protein (PEP-CTERM system associated)
MTGREMTMADYAAMLRRRWLLIAVLTLVGGPLAYGVARVLPTVYKSSTVVLVEESGVPKDIVEPVDQTDIGQRLASMQQQILSRSRLEPIIRQLNLYPNEIDRVPMEELVQRLQDTIDVTAVQPMAETRAMNLPGFSVSVTMANPQTAQQVCTAVTSLFIEENLRLRQQHSEGTTQFLSQQMTDAKAALDAQDAKLAAFQSAHMGDLPDEAQTNLNILQGLNSQLDATTQALSRAQQDKSFAESLLSEQVAAWQASQTGHDPETLQDQMAMLQGRLADLRTKYTDDYPDVIKTQHAIAALQQRITQQAETHKSQSASAAPNKAPAAVVEPPQVTQLRAQIHSYDQEISENSREQQRIKAQIQEYEARVQLSPAIDEQYKELTRGYQTALDTYNELQRKRDDSAMATRLEREQEGEQFTVLDPANLPDKPSFPDRLKFTLGGFGGGFALGLGLAALFEMRDTSLRTEQDVELVLHLPVLCVLPTVDPLSSNRARPRLKSGSVERLELGARS